MLHAVKNVSGAFVSEPKIHADRRGTFNEWFKASEFEAATGFPFDLQQSNISFSQAGVLRGLHFADVPPGQAKFVSCLHGRILDVIVDIREGSPTYLQSEAVELSGANRKSIYVPVGVAHGFAALDDATVAYLTSAEWDPDAEHEVNAFDERLSIEWPDTDYVLSDKDRCAPRLADIRLPQYEDCEDFENLLRDGWALANEEAGQ